MAMLSTIFYAFLSMCAMVGCIRAAKLVIKSINSLFDKIEDIRELKFPKEILSFLPTRGSPEEFVVGGKNPISYTQLRGIRKRINRDTGFGETITPRRFRTTVATDISAMTHDLKLVQRSLGHATPQMTLKHYDKGRKNAIDAASAIGKCYGIGGN